MSEDVRVLFRELAGLAPFDRENCYARQQVPTVVRDELESLFSFDSNSGDSILSFPSMSGSLTDDQTSLRGFPIRLSAK